MYSFESVVNRRGTNSLKWENGNAANGTRELLSLSVADMDFNVPPEVFESIGKRINHSVYGYSYFSDDYYESVIRWMDRRHNWKIEKDWIVYTPGIVTALSYALKAFTDVGDAVLVQTPVYHRFFDVINNNGRRIIENPLVERNGKYFMDFDDLEKKMSPDVKALVLCSPHNPVGRVWSREELSKLSDLCLKNNIIVISDEIHFDIIYGGSHHTVLASISPEIAQRSVICTAPTKTFNLAGIQVSNIIIPNSELRERYRTEIEKDHLIRPNILVEPALIAAYNKSEPWLENLLLYIKENRDFALKFLETRIPKLRAISPEGTYLIWIDCSEVFECSESLHKFFLEECGLILSNGIDFGKESEAFQRINIACPRAILEEALERIENALESI